MCVGELATKCSAKETFASRRGGFNNWTRKRWRRAHPIERNVPDPWQTPGGVPWEAHQVGAVFCFFERLHVHHTVVKSLAEGDFKKEPTSPLKERRGVSEEAGGAIAALPQAYSSNLETNPERAREEPCGTPDATGPGLHRE